jgi:bifunctional non-homologous end joining protein LigD
VYDGGRLRYAGNVGTGFTHAFLADLLARLEELQVPQPMFEGFEGTPRPRGARFVRPELVCEVEYLKWTQDDKLRAASFKGLRPDRLPTDARREHPVDRPS